MKSDEFQYLNLYLSKYDKNGVHMDVVARSKSYQASNDTFTNTSTSLIYISPTEPEEEVSYLLCYSNSYNLEGMELPMGMFQHWYKIYKPEYNMYTYYIGWRQPSSEMIKNDKLR